MSVPLSALHTRSMFGDQTLSKRASAPSFGFGSSTRTQAGKVFISHEHSKTVTGESPGPAAYTHRASVGPQIDGSKISSPTWMFGTAERLKYEKRAASSPGPGAYGMGSSFGSQISSAARTEPIAGFGSAGREHVRKVYVSEEHNKALHGIDSPGPLAYSLKTTVTNKQDSSRIRNPPTWVFGSTQRFKYEHVKRAASSPGPGAYHLQQSVGPQVASTKSSSPMAGFGTSDRTVQNKLYLSPDHEKMHYGKQSPGPSAYSLPGSVAKQTLSKNSSMPSWGFGTSARWSSDKKGMRSSTPGPGAYSV